MGENQRLSLVACFCQRCIPCQYSQRMLIQSDILWRQHQKVSSRLGPSKLRKFLQFYCDCYQNAKNNKKLKQSVQRAEQRLQQNSQDISVYETIRDEMRSKIKRGAKSDSRMSSGSKNENFDSIELSANVNRMKTPGNVRKFKSKSLNKNNNQVSDQFEEIKSQNSLKQQSVNDQSLEEKNKSRRKSENIKNHIHEIRLAKLLSQGNNQQISAQKQNNDTKNKIVIKARQTETNLQAKLNEEICDQKVQAKIVRRKGRPPKSLALIREREKELNKQKDIKERKLQEQKEKIGQQPSVVKSDAMPKTANRRLFIHKRVPRRQTSHQMQNLTSLTQKQGQSIKNNLNNRQQLVKILLEMNINVDNIKQILDLGVSLALQNGPINKSSHFLLSALKTTLLYKYFPDDSKHRKKYENITKQKKKLVLSSGFQQNHSEEQMIDEYKIITRAQEKNEDKSQQNIKKPKKYQLKEKEVQYEEQKLQQIRAKANNKLQKIIKKSGLNQGAQQLAIQIQKTFQETAEAKDSLYRNIAYERMRSIKDKLTQLREKKSNPQEVKRYLEQSLQVYRFQSIRRQIQKSQ